MVFKLGGFKRLLFELPSQQEYHNQHLEKGESRDNTGYNYWKANITIFLLLLADVLQYIKTLINVIDKDSWGNHTYMNGINYKK